MSGKDAKNAEKKSSKGASHSKYVVLDPGGTIHSGGHIVTLQPGKIISSQHYDIGAVERHGIKLLKIDE